jgi:hypothetical protein
LAAEAARTRRPPSLWISLAIALAIAAGVWLMLILKLPVVHVRTGMVLQSTRRHSPASVATFAVLFFVLLFPAIQVARRNIRRSKGGSGALICVACHEAQALGAPSCAQCGGALESMDRWEWIEPGTSPPAGAEVVNLVEIVSGAWGFTGLVPRRIVEVNAFGNLLVEDVKGRYWWIAPEILSCKTIAASVRELEQLRRSQDFQIDWPMERLVSLATSALGSPGPGRCFCLKMPAVLGGEYDRANLGTIALPELIAASGNMAEQIKDLPDGELVEIKIVD